MTASVNRTDDGRLIAHITVEAAAGRPPGLFHGWHSALGSDAPFLTLPGGQRAYPLADPVWEEVHRRMQSVPGSPFGPGRLGGGSGRVEQLLFAAPPAGTTAVDLDLPGRAAGAPRPFRFRLVIQDKAAVAPKRG